jgi:hypothetical protein
MDSAMGSMMNARVDLPAFSVAAGGAYFQVT